MKTNTHKTRQSKTNKENLQSRLVLNSAALAGFYRLAFLVIHDRVVECGRQSPLTTRAGFSTPTGQHTHTHTHTHARTHAHTHIHIHTRTQIHTHTHTHTPTS